VNTNVLEGFRCPKCGSDDRFRIEATTMFDVTDDGTEQLESSVDWSDESYCECRTCAHYGTVKDFKSPDEKKERGLRVAELEDHL